MQELIICFITLFTAYLFLKNYEKYYTLFILTIPFINEFVAPSFLAPINATVLLSFTGIIIYLYKYGFSFSGWKKAGVFWIMAFLYSSLLVSDYYASEHHLFSLFSVFTLYINIMIYWELLQKRSSKIILYTYKFSLLLGAVIGSYALLEVILGYNPYINLTSPLKLYTNNTIITEVRFGIKRTQTFFSMHETNAGFSYLLIVLLCFINCKKKSFERKKGYIVISLLVLNVFASGSRAAIIGISVLSLAFLKRKSIKVLLLLSPILLLLVVLFFQDYVTNIIDSITNTSQVDGSNAEMRSEQFNIALYYLLRSPWIGNGIAYTWTYVTVYDQNIFGAESLWLPVMIDQGVLGIISYIFFFLYSLYYCIKARVSSLCFFVVGFVVFNSLSSIPNISFTYVFVVISAITASYKSTNKKYAPVYNNPCL